MQNIPLILRDPLDNDAYNANVSHLMLHRHPDILAEHQLINRKGIKFPDGFANLLVAQVEQWGDVPVDSGVLGYNARQFPWTSDYVEFLRQYRINPRYISISQFGNQLNVSSLGPMHETTFIETPMLYTITELLGVVLGQKPNRDYVIWAAEKGKALAKAKAKVIEFGARRRFGYDVQYNVTKMLRHVMSDLLVGTSNMHLAYLLGLVSKGTWMHGYVSAMAAITGHARGANTAVMQEWHDEFGGKLDLAALTDTFTTPVFYDEYLPPYSDWFKFLREDSAEPPEKFTDNFVRILRQRDYDFTGRGILHSNGLTTTRVIDLQQYDTQANITPLFGVGTHFSNDVGFEAPELVWKLMAIWIDGIRVPTVKFSDVPGKVTGEPEAVARYKKELGI